YLSTTKGFTRWLFDEGPDRPTALTSVHEHEDWAGLNTSIYYGDALRQLLDLDGHEFAKSKPTEVARHYVIKIVGVPLFFRGQRLGELKVELPNTFDDSKHYDEADQQFLVDAASTVGEVLGEFRQFLEGEWFKQRVTAHVVINVTRMT